MNIPVLQSCSPTIVPASFSATLVLTFKMVSLSQPAPKQERKRPATIWCRLRNERSQQEYFYNATPEVIEGKADEYRCQITIDKADLIVAGTFALGLSLTREGQFANSEKIKLNTYRFQALSHRTVPTYGGQFSAVRIANLSRADGLARIVKVKVGTIEADAIEAEEVKLFSNDRYATINFLTPPMKAGTCCVWVRLGEDQPYMEVKGSVLTYYEPVLAAKNDAYDFMGLGFTLSPDREVGHYTFEFTPPSTSGHPADPGMPPEKVGPAKIRIQGSTFANRPGYRKVFARYEWQLINLSGSSTLANGDPVAIRVLITGKNGQKQWRCLRVEQLPTPPYAESVAPTTLVVDETSGELPKNIHEIFGIWRQKPDTDTGTPVIERSARQEILIHPEKTDLVLFVSGAFVAPVDPYLVDMEKGFLRPDLNHVRFATDDLFGNRKDPAFHPAFWSNSSRRCIFFSGFLRTRPTSAEGLAAMKDMASPNAGAAIAATHFSDIVLANGTQLMFATEAPAGRPGNIFYRLGGDENDWKPLMDAKVARSCHRGTGPIRAVVHDDGSRILLFQQSNAGLLICFPCQLDKEAKTLTWSRSFDAGGRPIVLSEGLQDFSYNSGAPVFNGRFEVICSGGYYHVFTVPVAHSSIIGHVRFDAINTWPFINGKTGVRIGFAGMPVDPEKTESPGSRLTDSFLQSGYQLLLPPEKVRYTGETPLSFEVISQGEGKIKWRCLGYDWHSDVALVPDTPLNLEVTDSAGVMVARLCLVLSKGQNAAKTLPAGDFWHFQIAPRQIDCQAGPKNKGTRTLHLDGPYLLEKAMHLDISFQDEKQPNLLSISSPMAGVVTTPQIKIPPVAASDASGLGTNQLPLPQSTAVSLENGLGLQVTFSSMGKHEHGDCWKVMVHPAIPAVDHVTESPTVLAEAGDPGKVLLAWPTTSGAGRIVLARYDLERGCPYAGTLTGLRARSEPVLLKEASGEAMLRFQGVVDDQSASWEQAVLANVGDKNSVYEQLYPNLGHHYRTLYPGWYYCVAVDGVTPGKAQCFSTPLGEDGFTDPAHPAKAMGSQSMHLLPPLYRAYGIGRLISTGHYLRLGIKETLIPRLLQAMEPTKPDIGLFANSIVFAMTWKQLEEMQKKSMADLMEKMKTVGSINTKIPFNDPVDPGNPKSFFTVNHNPAVDDPDKPDEVFKAVWQLLNCRALIQLDKPMLERGELYGSGFPVCREFWKNRMSEPAVTTRIRHWQSTSAFQKTSFNNREKAFYEVFGDQAGQPFEKVGGIGGALVQVLANPCTVDQLQAPGGLPWAVRDGLLKNHLFTLLSLSMEHYLKVIGVLIQRGVLKAMVNAAETSSAPGAITPEDDASANPDHNAWDDHSVNDLQGYAMASQFIPLFAGSLEQLQQTLGKIPLVLKDKMNDFQDAMRHWSRARPGLQDAMDARNADSRLTYHESQPQLAHTMRENALADQNSQQAFVDLNRKVQNASALGEQDKALMLDIGKMGLLEPSIGGFIFFVNAVSIWHTWDDEKQETFHYIRSTGQLLAAASLGIKVVGQFILYGAQKVYQKMIVKAMDAGLTEMQKQLNRATRMFLKFGKFFEFLSVLTDIGCALQELADTMEDFKNKNEVQGLLGIAAVVASIAVVAVDVALLANLGSAAFLGPLGILLGLVVLEIALIKILCDEDMTTAFGYLLVNYLFWINEAEKDFVKDNITNIKSLGINLQLSKPINDPLVEGDIEPFSMAIHYLDFPRSAPC